MVPFAIASWILFGTWNRMFFRLGSITPGLSSRKLAGFINSKGFMLPGKKLHLLHLNDFDMQLKLSWCKPNPIKKKAKSMRIGERLPPVSAPSQACYLLCTHASKMAFCISGFYSEAYWEITSLSQHPLSG